MGAELGKKIDSLGEVLLLKNLPENERKAVCNNVPKPPAGLRCGKHLQLGANATVI
jgi:hypothetical protein